MSVSAANNVATEDFAGNRGLVTNQKSHSPEPGSFVIYDDLYNDATGLRRKRPGIGAPIQNVAAGGTVTVMHEFTKVDPATGVITYYKFRTFGAVIERWNAGALAWQTCVLGGVTFSGTAWQFVNSRNRCFAINGVDGIFYFDGTTGPDGREWYWVGIAAPVISAGYSITAVDAPYSTGFITFTKGGVTGRGSPATVWVTGLAWVDKFIDIAGVRYQISTIDAITPGVLTLKEPYRGDVPDPWVRNKAYAFGDFVQPTTGNGLYYECTVAGTSHATTEPVWPTVVGNTIVDNGVTWTCRAGLTYSIYIGLMEWSEPPVYAYSYYNTATGHSSNISPLTQITEKDKIGVTPRITGIPYSPTDFNNGYDKIQMWRSAKDGDVLVAINPTSGGRINNSNAAGTTSFTETVNTYRDVNLTKESAPIVSNRKPLSGRDLAVAITGATNATPIVITTGAAHGLVTGQLVVNSGVTGNTAANGTWIITVLSGTTFSLNGSVGNGGYVSGGVITLAAAFSAIAEWNGRLWALAPREAKLYYSAISAEIPFGRSDECWPANNSLDIADTRGLLRVGQDSDDQLLVQTGTKNRVVVGFNILNFKDVEVTTDEQGGGFRNEAIAVGGTFLQLYGDKKLIDNTNDASLLESPMQRRAIDRPNIGKPIQPDLNAIPTAQLAQTAMIRFVYQDWNLLLVSVAVAAGDNTLTYVFDYHASTWYRWTLGFSAFAVVHNENASNALELWGALASDKKVYRLLQPNVFTDNGANITPAMRTCVIRPFGYGKQGFFKWFKMYVSDPAQTWQIKTYVDEDATGQQFPADVPDFRWQSAAGKELMVTTSLDAKKIGECYQHDVVWPTTASDLYIEKMIEEWTLEQDVESRQ